MDYQGFPAGWLDELKSKANLLQMVSTKVALTRKGNLWWGCCPFHHEKTPSFAVDEARAFFHCYGCHEGGDVISWVQKTEALPFIDAVKYIAGTVGMKMPELNPNAKAEYAKKERLYEMMKAAARHYYANYTRNTIAQDYWASRGLSKETIIKFGLGYSVGGQALIDDLTKQGYTLREMQSCSLVGMSDRDGSYYDFLAGRVIVPIFDDMGRVIAFGGRVLEKKENVAKYKNSRETELFQKNRTLYGLNFVKKYRLRHRVDDIIVTEGYMDVIALVEAGFNNVVASMGTALTEQQAKMLKRLVERVYICYDGDAAGQSSTMRGLEILKRAGLDVRVMSMPDGLDPDEIIRRRGKAAYQACIDKALPLYEYKIVKAAENYDLTSADGRGNYAKACLRIIADLDDVEREAYLTMISERSAVGIEGIRRMAGKMAQPTAKPTEIAPSDKQGKQLDKSRLDYFHACRMVLRLMLENPNYVDNWLPDEYFTDPEQQAVCRYVLTCITEGTAISPGNVYRLGISEEECNQIMTTVLPSDPEELKAEHDKATKLIVRDWLRQQRDMLNDAIAESVDPDEKSQLLRQIDHIMTELKQIGG